MTRRSANLCPTPSSMHFGVVGSDLFIPLVHRNGKEILWVLGDTFGGLPANRNMLAGKHDSPVILVSSIEKPYEFHRCIGGSTVRSILKYPPGISTILPTSWIYVGSRIYLHYMLMGPGGLSDTRGTGIAYSDDDGESWTDPGQMWPGGAYGGVNNMNVFFTNRPDDGYMYCLRNRGLARNSNVVMFRVPINRILDANAYRPWGLRPDHAWDWLAMKDQPWPILPNDVRAGEMGAAWIEDKLVITYFRGDSIEIRVGDKGPMTNWTTAPAHRPIKNTAWGMETPYSAAQLYGGYPLLPFSTLKNMHVVGSQWETAHNTVYRGMVFDQIDVSFVPVPHLPPPPSWAAVVEAIRAALGRR